MKLTKNALSMLKNAYLAIYRRNKVNNLLTGGGGAHI